MSISLHKAYLVKMLAKGEEGVKCSKNCSRGLWMTPLPPWLFYDFDITARQLDREWTIQHYIKSGFILSYWGCMGTLGGNKGDLGPKGHMGACGKVYGYPRGS